MSLKEERTFPVRAEPVQDRGRRRSLTLSALALGTGIVVAIGWAVRRAG